MPVKTKCLFDPPEESDGTRILISRGMPKGISEEKLQAKWMKQLGPSDTLLRKWKEGKLRWGVYAAWYRGLMEDGCRKELYALTELAKLHPITLLCWEKETNPHSIVIF